MLDDVKISSLEITAVEPETGDILYLPCRIELNGAQLREWMQGHHTTVFDVNCSGCRRRMFSAWSDSARSDFFDSL
jgi:hypothetical protein